MSDATTLLSQKCSPDIIRVRVQLVGVHTYSSLFPIVVPWYPLPLLPLYHLVGISEGYVFILIKIQNLARVCKKHS